MAVAHNGGFDGAKMTLRRAFFDDSYKIIGVVGLFTGLCEVTQGGGLTLKLNVKSIVQKLNIEYPNRRYYPQCPFSVYSKECGVDIKRFRKSGKVTGLGSGANSIREWLLHGWRYRLAHWPNGGAINADITKQ